MPKFCINAKKLVQLVQVEIDAENKENAIQKYLIMANTDQLEILDPRWYDFPTTDLEIEIID